MSNIIVPEHNSDPAKVVLMAKAKDSPFVKEWYTAARKSFIAVVNSYNAKTLPDWIYRDEPKALLSQLRLMWNHFQLVFPTLGFETKDGNDDILALVANLQNAGEPIDSRLKTCQVWLTYSNNLKGLRVKVDDFCMDNIYFNMRKSGQLQIPGEPPREQQTMEFYSDSFDPTGPFYGIHQGKK